MDAWVIGVSERRGRGGMGRGSKRAAGGRLDQGGAGGWDFWRCWYVEGRERSREREGLTCEW